MQSLNFFCSISKKISVLLFYLKFLSYDVVCPSNFDMFFHGMLSVNYLTLYLITPLNFNTRNKRRRLQKRRNGGYLGSPEERTV